MTIITSLRNYFLHELNYAPVKQSPDDGRSVVSQHGLGSVSHIIDVDLMEPWIQSLGYDKK